MKLSPEHRDWLTLVMVPGVGTTHFIRLLARFQTPANVLRAPRLELEDLVGKKLASHISQYSDTGEIEHQERLIEKYNVTLVTLEDKSYPARLAEIYDPPLALFVRGELIEQDEHSVAIVGTRKATPYGIRMAEKFAGELAARGITVISGMASGVDTAAHNAAIEAGGRTIAVLGNGVDVVYPQRNADLMNKICQHGCVISQFPMGVKPSRGHFPYRNRIISGITQGTLIVEAPLRSGALITARHAADQGREVFAVPGQVGSINSSGPHSLIRDGSKLVETVEDILVELDVPASIRQQPVKQQELPIVETETAVDKPVSQAKLAPKKEPVANVSGNEKLIMSALSPDGSFVDEIAASCRISVSETLSSLTLLELKGLVRQFSGKRFAPR